MCRIFVVLFFPRVQMQGPPENPGVNTRALSKLFDVAAERFPDIKYEVRVSLLEIYNENIHDLLGDKGKAGEKRVLKAVQGQYGMEVQDLTMVSVSNQKEVLETLKKGSKNRTVVATNMNDVSSRSHLILSVYVMARNNITGKDTMGKRQDAHTCARRRATPIETSLCATAVL